MSSRSIDLKTAAECMGAAEKLGADVYAQGWWVTEDGEEFDASKCPILRIDSDLGMAILLRKNWHVLCAPRKPGLHEIQVKPISWRLA